MKIRVPQLRLYKDVPLLEGPRLPWSSFERGNVRLRNELACPRHQFLDTDLSQLFGDWMAQAGGWLTSVETDLDTKSLGRGVHVAIEMQPLAMPDIPLERLWKNPSLDYWQALAAWVETFQRHTGFDKPATRDLKVRMRELIGKAAARIENLRVELEGLHFDEARKLKSLLYKVGFWRPMTLLMLSMTLVCWSIISWKLCSNSRLRSGPLLFKRWLREVENQPLLSGRKRLNCGPFRIWLSRSDLRLGVTIGKPNGVRHGEADAATAWPCFDFLESLARKQVATLKPVSTVQIVETLKGTPNKKGGPDECTF